MSNHLAYETSPYLLQHKDNPVDWYPWGEEALTKARELNRPLLVSIGYAACHWCHVMERESFEDPDVAAYMNDNFICIKVDREERPDVDAIYMEAVQLITGHGGWPLNAFATPEQVPFHAGTYFPPQPRQGMPSWRQVLEAVSEAWRERPDEILGGSDRLRDRLGISALVEPSPDPIDPGMPGQAVLKLGEQFDAAHGGFGSAPKFPQAPVIEFLLGRWTTGDPEAARMAERTLEGMISGAMYDQIGGGFARYSVDARWEIPHFEKMLYDNAPLARCYLRGWQLTERPEFQAVCRETLDFMLRELCDPEGGGFYSSLDADSEGEEGKFYAWTVGELRELLGQDAEAAIEYFGASEVGNFEGKCALLRRGAPPAELESIKQRLMAARASRVRPGLDDKRLTAWNALAIAALAEAGAVLDEPRYVEAAVRCAEFVLRELTDQGGRLLRSYNRGKAMLPGFLDDYAYTVEALISLYEATFDPRWLYKACELADLMIEHFADPDYGGFFSTSDDAEQLVARRKEFDDSPIPSGLSSAALGLQRLALLTANSRYEDHAVGSIKLALSMAANHPGAFGELLQAVEFQLATNREVALVGSDTKALEQIYWEHFRPFDVIAGGPPADIALLQDRHAVNGKPTAYVCVGYVCDAPQTDPAAFAKQLT